MNNRNRNQNYSKNNQNWREQNWRENENGNDRNSNQDRGFRDESYDQNTNRYRQGEYSSQNSSYGGQDYNSNQGGGYSDRNFGGRQNYSRGWQSDNQSGYGASSLENENNDWRRNNNNYADFNQSGYGNQRPSYQNPDGYSNESYSSNQNYNNNYGQRRGNWDRAKDEVSSWFGDDDAQRRRNMDQQQDEHRGKGPKGYRRSDDRIKEDVNDRLTDDGALDASDIEVNVKNGEVILTGTVNGRWAKRRAEDMTEAVSGVSNVENRIKVKQEEFTSTTNYSSANKSNTEKSTDHSKVKA